MTTTELKQQLLSKSFGGIMYDVTEGSNITKLVLDNEAIANVLVDEMTVTNVNGELNGIDKGIVNFICEILAKDMARA